MAMFKKTFVLILSACISAQRIDMNAPAHVEARQDSITLSIPSGLPTGSATATINASKISAELGSFLSQNPISQEFTTVSETLGISVPSSLQVAIITAVPASVLVKLINPSARCSLAEAFQAGSTPAWYTSMPADVRSWFEQFAGELSTGSPVFTVTSTPSATATAEPGDSVVEGPAAETSTSHAMAARQTGADWGVAASAVALAGVLGVGIAL